MSTQREHSLHGAIAAAIHVMAGFEGAAQHGSYCYIDGDAMTRLEGRTAVITGGASGIGLAVAQLLAANGATVVLASRSRERGETAAEVLVASGARALFIETDVERPEDVEHLMERVVDSFGSLDILFNNSGVNVSEEPDGPTIEDWDRLFAVNVRGVWLCCHAALPHLLRSKGVIINTGSMAGLVGVAGSPGYAASKAAVISLTRSLALAYADRGVRVNAICPGPIATSMTFDEWESMGTEEGRRRALAVVPARRIGTPEEVASLVLYLASDDAAFVTGAAVAIDGGKTAGLMSSERYRW